MVPSAAAAGVGGEAVSIPELLLAAGVVGLLAVTILLATLPLWHRHNDV